MGLWIRWIITLGLLGGYVACSPKEFSKDPGVNPCQNSNKSCVSSQGIDTFDYVEKIYGGKVDILVVNDNSASMSTEQAQLANRFSGFIQNLENKFIQYRIGMVTTDVSGPNNLARPINGNGALQDGRLIDIGGTKYISNESGTLMQKDAAFKAAVKRNETLSCESFILGWQGARDNNPAYSQAYADHCPSGDERGILAAALNIDLSTDFHRPEADLAVIILSDEDVRRGAYCSQWGTGNSCLATRSEYALSERDKTSGFMSLMQSKFPNKKYAVHSIITATSNCLSSQNSQTGGLVGASYGIEYANLSNATGGITGDICASDYALQLQNIFNNLASNIVDKVSLACSSPQDLTLTLTNNSDPTVTWALVGQEVRFSKKLPVGTTVRVHYSCPSL